MQQIPTGIASFGMSGKLFHAPFIEHHPGFKLSAIVERNKNESREKYPNSKLYRSYEELISDKEITLIIVNTPVQTHYDYVKLALNAGKDVVVEKPFTVDAKEAQELDDLAKAKGKFLCVYQNRRYDGDYRAVKAVIEKNLLGEIKEAEIRYDRYRTEFSGKGHKEGGLRGAGILHDLGAHMIDQSLQLFGKPEGVFADLRILRGGDVAANDYFEVLLYYPSLRVRLKSTVIARESHYAYVMHGMKGSFLQNRSDVQEAQLLNNVIPSLEPWAPSPSSPDGLLHTEIDGVVVKEPTLSSSGNYMEYYDDVYKALIGEAPNPVPASDAVLIMQIIDAAVKSNDEKAYISLT